MKTKFIKRLGVDKYAETRVLIILYYPFTINALYRSVEYNVQYIGEASTGLGVSHISPSLDLLLPEALTKFSIAKMYELARIVKLDSKMKFLG